MHKSATFVRLEFQGPVQDNPYTFCLANRLTAFVGVTVVKTITLGLICQVPVARIPTLGLGIVNELRNSYDNGIGQRDVWIDRNCHPALRSRFSEPPRRKCRVVAKAELLESKVLVVVIF